MEQTVEEYGIYGLANSGNTCYMNASIQAISNVYLLRTYLFQHEQEITDTLLHNAPKIFMEGKSFERYSEMRTKIMDPEYDPNELEEYEKIVILNSTMTYQLIKLLKAMWDLKSPINPISFRKIFTDARDKFFYGRDQHDAEEAYNCIIQKMQEEMASEKKLRFMTTNTHVVELLTEKTRLSTLFSTTTDPEEKDTLTKLYNNIKKKMPDENLILESFSEMEKYCAKSWSIITEQFTGFLHSRITCPKLECGFSSNKFDPFLHISLSLPENAISIYDCMADYCKEEILDDDNLWQCGGCHEKVKASKGFSIWNHPINLVIHLKRFNNARSRKDPRLITYPINDLDIESIMSPINKTSMQCKCYLYDLQSIVCHGGSMNSGHYFAYCKNSATDKWYNHNDTNVDEIDDTKLVTNMAYLLFYVRRDQFVD